MTRLLDSFPKPFLDDIVAGRCVPFVGAGMSRNAQLAAPHRMPLWEDLATELGNLIPHYKYSGALDAISAFEHNYSRTKLVEQLSEMLHVMRARPGSAHAAFCRLPFPLVVTSNFEFLLERGYEAVGRYCRPIVHEDQLSVHAPDAAVNLIKFHGDLHHPSSLVATEEDYAGFISRNPLLSTFLGNLLIENTAFFIGYSLDDPDFRQIWQIVGDRLGRLRRLAYTIKVNAPHHEIARFERRGVRVVNLPGNPADYPKLLEQAFDELLEYWNAETLKRSAVAEDEPAGALSLPKGSDSLLCLFIVPREVLWFYKTYVFPLVERYGLTPMTADDLIAPGDLRAAKISALVARAGYVVVDLSTRHTMMEAGIVFGSARAEAKQLVIIAPGSDLPVEWLSRAHTVRPENLSDVPGSFLQAIENWFHGATLGLPDRVTSEPQRLFMKKEYNAAVVSAIAALEVELQHRLRAVAPRLSLSLRALLKLALDKELLSREEVEAITEWSHIRNQIVHNEGRVERAQAKMVVDGINKLIARFPPRPAEPVESRFSPG